MSKRLGLKANIILDEKDEDEALLNAIKQEQDSPLLNEKEKEEFQKSLSS